jgi:hypothetical protein
VNEKKLARFAKVVILKHMFTLEEIKADPTLLLDIKEEIREECDRIGEVTNLVLYDVCLFELPKKCFSWVHCEPLARACACIE